MLISVIIPTLNEEQVLPRTLAHTAGLDFDELIVVDGGSSDRTQQIVRSLGYEARGAGREAPPSNPEPRTSHLRLITSAAGRATQMNVGAAASAGNTLLFLHADTLLPPDAKPTIQAAMSDPACVGGRFDLRFERDAGPGWLISRLINLRSRWTGIATGDQAIFVRRQVFEQVGGFSAIPIMEDVDFTRRLKGAGRIACLRSKVITSYRRWNACGPIRTILLMWFLRFLYWIGVSPHRLSQLYAHVR